MTKLRMKNTNSLEELSCHFYFFDDEGGSGFAGVFNVDDVLAFFSMRASICLTCLEL